MAPSRYDWKIVDWDVKPQHNQPTNLSSVSKLNYQADWSLRRTQTDWSEPSIDNSFNINIQASINWPEIS